MIKLVASDLDGTLLLNGAQTLPEELFPLIRKLKEKGILFVAASGRQYPNMRRLFEPVKDDMGFICENGAMAVRNEKILYQDCFESGLAREIAEAIYKTGDAEFSCATRDFYYIMPKTRHFLKLMTEVVKTESKVIESFDEITEPCMKLAVYEKDGVQEDTIRYWREQFGRRCTVVTSGFAWVDFIPFGTNKARGLEEYRKMLGIRPEECMAFGDEYNDIEMLKATPYGFAMRHSKPGVREAAGYTADRVEPLLEALIKADGNIEEVLKNVQ